MGERKISSGLRIGAVLAPGRVWLAPMSGVSDLPFRQTAAAWGASYISTEMVACAGLAGARPDAVRRAAMGKGFPLMVIQLVGRDPHWIARGARLARAAGAHIIDLNFGCPAREVTGVQCGSALMRDLDLAQRLIEAAVEAVDTPVTVKMRLGWDDASRNAPELAARAQAVGARAITVHGRTRCQFYAGAADWSAVRAVKQAVQVPVVVNGDIVDVASAQRALAQSGADAVMVGRGAIGRPWIAAELEATLSGRTWRGPSEEDLAATVLDHLEASLSFYGERPGLRMFRKHLARYIDTAGPAEPQARREARLRLCTLDSPADLRGAIAMLWAAPVRRLAA